MGYDELDRLSTASGLWGSGSYSYDALGNITSKTEGGQTMAYHYDTNNRLTSITGASPVSYGTQDFDYNRAGNMVSSTGPSITYQYDGHKRRVQQTQGGQTEYTMYSQSGTLLHKKVGGVTTDYIYAGQMLIARNNSGTGLHYLHTDLLGSPIEGQAGSTGYTEHYTPWGEKLSDPIQLADDVGYTGHQSDTATGLTYMQARYYDPVVGRFMAVDPVGFFPYEPDSFNRYSYVGNKPYSYTDPTGMSAKAMDEIIVRGRLDGRTFDSKTLVLWLEQDEPAQRSTETRILATAARGDHGEAVFLLRQVLSLSEKEIAALMRRMASKRANELVKQLARQGINSGARSGQHGIALRRAAAQLEREAKLAAKGSSAYASALRAQAKRMFNQAKGINHK